MTVAVLVTEFMASRLTGGLVLTEAEVTTAMVKAYAFAGYATLAHFANQPTPNTPNRHAN